MSSISKTIVLDPNSNELSSDGLFRKYKLKVNISTVFHVPVGQEGTDMGFYERNAKLTLINQIFCEYIDELINIEDDMNNKNYGLAEKRISKIITSMSEVD
jgi:hypothetical protein